MRIKGNVLNARKAFIRQRYGDEALARVLAYLSGDERAVLSGFIS